MLQALCTMYTVELKVELGVSTLVGVLFWDNQNLTALRLSLQAKGFVKLSDHGQFWYEFNR